MNVDIYIGCVHLPSFKGQLGVFNLGILGDEITHKYPRAIGHINRDFPFSGVIRWARGAVGSLPNSPDQ